MKYLSQKGYQMLPVNPRVAGQTLLGETVQAKLADVGPVDMVEVFRRGEEAPMIAEEAVQCGAKVLWLQIGVVSEEAREIAERNGLQVVMNRCPKIEYSRLWGELGWQGINTGVISSQRRHR
jgi:predicted CoA-binding protein